MLRKHGGVRRITNLLKDKTFLRDLPSFYELPKLLIKSSVFACLSGSTITPVLSERVIFLNAVSLNNLLCCVVPLEISLNPRQHSSGLIAGKMYSTWDRISGSSI